MLLVGIDHRHPQPTNPTLFCVGSRIDLPSSPTHSNRWVGWQSGLMHRTDNLARLRILQGFESLTYRHHLIAANQAKGRWLLGEVRT